MDKREAFSALAADAGRGVLAFPTSAQVGMRVRKALDDPDCHVGAAAVLVQAEPHLAARVVALANSVAYNRSGRPVTDVRTAVGQVGFSIVHALATALVARQLADHQASDKERALANQLWQHTAHVASLAHVIARRITRIDPETALFAGIVHEVAGFYLFSRSGDFPGLLDGDYSDWIDGGEVEVGSVLLDVLEVPVLIKDAVKSSWHGYLTLPPANLADTLLLAEELAPVLSPLHHPFGLEPGEDHRSSIDLVLGAETLSSILEDAAHEVESLSGALKV